MPPLWVFTQQRWDVGSDSLKDMASFGENLHTFQVVFSTRNPCAYPFDIPIPLHVKNPIRDNMINDYLTLNSKAMTHSFMASAFQSAIRTESKGKKSLRSSKLNNFTPSLFDTIGEEAITEAVQPTPEALASVEVAYNAHMAYLESRRSYVAEPCTPLWQAVALDYNGAEYTEEVEAWSEEAANAIAEKRFEAQGISIYLMLLYRF